MNCINTGCTIYNGCKIKEVAEHCIVHQKLVMPKKDSFIEQGQMNLNPGPANPDEMAESYDGKQKN